MRNFNVQYKFYSDVKFDFCNNVSDDNNVTVLQHVSMYHRNKVHTDEFWRYELTKNRRTGLDDKANEDLWKKQLGKHAEEAAKLKQEAQVLHINLDNIRLHCSILWSLHCA